MSLVTDLSSKNPFQDLFSGLQSKSLELRNEPLAARKKRLKALEAENARLKKLLAESMLENEVTREALRKK